MFISTKKKQNNTLKNEFKHFTTKKKRLIKEMKDEKTCKACRKVTEVPYQ